MTEQKVFYEIQVPKKETELVFRLVEISNLYEPERCMHKMLDSRKRCTESPIDQCDFCGLWTCIVHFDNSQHIWIEQNSGFGNNGACGYMASPCDNCARLSKEDLLKLRALKLEINR